MLPLALLGLFLWISLLLWRFNTKTVATPMEGEESPSGWRPPPAGEDLPPSQSPHPGEQSHSTISASSTQSEGNRPQASSASRGLEPKTVDSEVLQAPSKVNSGLTPTTQESPKTHLPMRSSGPEMRERLKFILGASEDNSSDEEPVVSEPLSDASQPLTSDNKSSPQQASPSQLHSSSSGIK